MAVKAPTSVYDLLSTCDGQVHSSRGRGTIRVTPYYMCGSDSSVPSSWRWRCISCNQNGSEQQWADAIRAARQHTPNVQMRRVVVRYRSQWDGETYNETWIGTPKLSPWTDAYSLMFSASRPDVDLDMDLVVERLHDGRWVPDPVYQDAVRQVIADHDARYGTR